MVSIDKRLNGTVVSPLHIVREKAGWQFTHVPVVSYAFAANTFPGTRFIGTVALCFVFLNPTFSHNHFSPKSWLLPSLVKSALQKERGYGNLLHLDGSAGDPPTPTITEQALQGIILGVTIATMYL